MAITRIGTYPQIKGNVIKTPCRVATTANVASLSGLLTIDTVTVSAGDRVLVWQQDTASENNIYIASGGAWTTAIDTSLADDLFIGVQVYVWDGSEYIGKLFSLTDDSPITFVPNITHQVLTAAQWAALTPKPNDDVITLIVG